MPSIKSDLDFSSCRSFEPILRLLPQGISPVSQHWATWALYNLVSVYRVSQMLLNDLETLNTKLFEPHFKLIELDFQVVGVDMQAVNNKPR